MPYNHSKSVNYATSRLFSELKKYKDFQLIEFNDWKLIGIQPSVDLDFPESPQGAHNFSNKLNIESMREI
jgi:hypothetical protein